MGERPLMVTEEEAKALLELLRAWDGVQMQGSGGIEVHKHGKKASFVFRGKRPAGMPAGGEMITFKITGNAAGNSKYVGRSFLPATSDVDASTFLAEGDLGTIATSDDCLILALPELGRTTTGHDLTAAANVSQFSLYGIGRLDRVNSDGTKVIHAAEFWAGC